MEHKQIKRNSYRIPLLIIAIVLNYNYSFSQGEKTEAVMIKAAGGDEQGLELYDGLVLQQDTEALKEANEVWWPQAMRLHDKRVSWLSDAKFGCFIHWGVYSQAAGEWEGEGTMGYAEHLMRARKIPLAKYKERLVATFNPIDFNAEEWMKAAKDAGMRYFIITAKHHDGFAMYPSDAYPYDIRLTPFKRDPMRELRDAASRYGIKFGLYYSHAFDWEHPDAPGNDWDYQNPGGDKLLHDSNWWENYPEFLPHAEKYVDEKSIPQIKELIRNYHPDILWFDTPHKLPLYLNLKILRTIWDTDPNITVNGRLAEVHGKNFGDYINTGDRAAFFRPVQGVWETVPTTNESYGYNKFDLTHKSPLHFIRLLASAAAKGGNILLNVGPMGNGKWDPIDVNILQNIGKWMKTNGESIYGTSRNPLSIQSWGEVTQKDNVFYLHVFHWPKNGQLVVGGLKATVEKAFLLSDATKKSLKTVRVDDKDMMIQLPLTVPDTINTVVVLKLKGVLCTDSVRLLSSTQDNQLLVFDATLYGDGFKYGDGKMNCEYVFNWKNKDQYIVWEVRLNQSSEFSVSLAYNTATKDESGEVIIEIDEQKYPTHYEPYTQRDKPALLVIRKVKLGQGNHVLKLTLGNYLGNQLLQPLFVRLTPCK